MTNFGEYSYNLVLNQHVSTADPHPTSLIEYHMSHREVLGQVIDLPSNDNWKFQKFVFNPCNMDFINLHVLKERTVHLNDEQAYHHG